jgi:hypothetical protein
VVQAEQIDTARRIASAKAWLSASVQERLRDIAMDDARAKVRALTAVQA